MDTMIGQTISHYTIVARLGQGGMGVVYKAHDTKLDRDVALKFLPATLQTTSEEIARFEQEARAISALNHPHIATIFDVSETDGCRYLVLEYIAGGTLNDKLKQRRSEGGQFPMSDVLEYGVEIAEGLAHAHRHGIVHRDVKAENIMLTEEGTVKLTDFGLAKLRGNVHITSAGSTLGTAAYMSPEQIRGEEVDHRSDIFSYGIVLYELATTQRPFQGDFEAALSYAILNEPPLPAASRRPDVPEGLERIINRCLEKDPAQRYQNAADIVTDLKNLQQGHASAGLPATKRLWIPVAVGAAATLVIAALFALWYVLSSSKPPDRSGKTIAVLPFVNLAGDKEEEYFSDGITEDILAQLVKIGDLNVISRTSVMQYKGTKKSIREIGEELSAGMILEGSVRHAGDQVRIVAQLIDATTDKHLWADTYDREYKQIFAIQSEIAQHIAGALKTRLSPVEVAKLNAVPEANTAAYSLFLQGRYFGNRRDGPSNAKAVELYQRALAIDSTDARIWAALSDAYFQLANTAYGSFKDPATRAREAALKSVALDDNLAEGHRALALVLHVFDWDWQGAEREFRKALALEPGNAAIVYQMSYLSATIGKFDESIMLGEKAIRLDPILDRNYFALGFNSHYAGRYAESMSLARKTLELNSLYPCAHDLLAMNYLELGHPDSAVVEAQAESTEVWRLHGMALAYYGAGRTHEADQALAELISKYRDQGPFQIAEVYGYRGEGDRTFEWLETAYKMRDGGLSQIVGDPRFKKVENDTRFKDFLRKLKLLE